jgi:hypothetical protein
MEALVLSSDPKVAALQSDIEELLRLSEADYEIVHRRLVRKVSKSNRQELTSDRHPTLTCPICAPGPQLSRS